MKQIDQPELGRSLRAFREKRGLKGREFCEKTGISQSHLSEIENGRKNLTENLAQRILRGFHLTAKELTVELCDLGKKNSEPPEPIVKEDANPYLVDNGSYRELAMDLAKSLGVEHCWEMVHDFTNKAREGDIPAARKAQSLIQILTDLNQA